MSERCALWKGRRSALSTLGRSKIRRALKGRVAEPGRTQRMRRAFWAEGGRQGNGLEEGVFLAVPGGWAALGGGLEPECVLRGWSP